MGRGGQEEAKICYSTLHVLKIPAVFGGGRLGLPKYRKGEDSARQRPTTERGKGKVVLIMEACP